MDPDAAARDQAEAEARQIAESLELPAGYEVVEITLLGAQTPKENRGGGQGGYFSVVFQPPERLAPSAVLADFDDWFTGMGMARAAGHGAIEECTDELVQTEWADSEKVVSLTYWHDDLKHVTIPYSFRRVVTQETPAIETGVPLPDCPGA
jgi:hypothetical protein